MSQDLPVAVYTPDSLLASPAKLLREMFSDLAAGRELAWRLAVRDIKAQYRQTFLGFLWAFILPLANTVTWVFLYKVGIVSVTTTVLPYSAYALSGAMLWAIFMDALNAPLQQMNAARPLLTKLNFPREALILSGIYQSLFNAAIRVGLVLVVLISMGIYPTWTLGLAPLSVLSLVLFGTAFGLFISPLGMLYGDVGRALPLLMQFMMYLTPVVFPAPKEGFASILFTINPLTPLIITARDWLTGQSSEFLSYFVFVNLLAVFLLILAGAAYRLAMPILVERMNA
jgi:lipopolysaccharide transport system permease protein